MNTIFDCVLNARTRTTSKASSNANAWRRPTCCGAWLAPITTRPRRRCRARRPRARIVPFRRRPDTAHLRVACLPPRSATSSSKPSPRYPRWAPAAGNSWVWGLLDPPNSAIDIACAARSLKGGMPPYILAIPSCTPLCIHFIPRL